MNLLNFVVDCMLGSEINLDKKQVELFVNLIEKYCLINATDKMESATSLSHQEETFSLTKSCMDQLFKLAQAKNKDSANPKNSISRIVLPTLIQRCKEIIEKYINDEKIYGSMSIPR